jgi:hypothetical protein
MGAQSPMHSLRRLVPVGRYLASDTLQDYFFRPLHDGTKVSTLALLLLTMVF